MQYNHNQALATGVWMAMTQKIIATFDGNVFHPDEPLNLAANTRVQIIIEPLPSEELKSVSFLQTAQSLNLDGPPDWSTNLDTYLYHQES